MNRSMVYLILGTIMAVIIILTTGCGSQADYEYNCAMKGEHCAKTDRTASTKEGPQGPRGPAGQACQVESFSNGAVITCSNTSAVVYNGKDGTDGEDGVDGKDGEDAPVGTYTFTESIDPCGSESQFDEVLFRTGAGELVAHYSKGNKQFLTFIGPGSYKTTDGTNCLFTVNSDLEVSW